MISHERLLNLVAYDPATGIFTAKVKRGNVGPGQCLGASIGSSGYLSISLDYKKYQLHRLAWFYVTGAWPEQEIDHRDGCKTNNAWDNLRPASRSENGQNRRGPRVDSTSGCRGVYFMGNGSKPWRARVIVDGCYNEQRFSTLLDAAAYAAATRRKIMPFSREAGAR